MKVKERIPQLIDMYNKTYRNIDRDGIVYKEVSSRFPNGKEILCKIEDFIREFGECETSNMYGKNRFDFGNAHYEILKTVDYIAEMERLKKESPIIVGEDFAIEMMPYIREVDQEYLLRSDFQNEKLYDIGKKRLYYTERKINLKSKGN